MLKFVFVTLPVGIIASIAYVFLLPYFIIDNKCKPLVRPRLPTLMFWLNVIFAWTLVGWLILLVIALACHDHRRNYRAL